MRLVEVRDATFFYGAQEVFTHISFHVGPGEVFCLLGPNGCGKTTLLDCILGLHHLHSGSILIGGKDAESYRPGKIARQIAYVPQRHEPTFPYTVREIVTMGRAAYLRLFESPSAADRRMADEALEHIGIAHLRNRPYTQLSGGETQMVMIARALVQHTPVVILDEPTAHLDFRYELVILEVIAGMVKEKGLSIIMATHSPNHALHFHDNGINTTVAMFHKGAFFAVGNPESVLNEDNLKHLYGVKARVITLDEEGRIMKQVVPLKTM
ncbi:Iron(III) ABC transporter, ATP-binding protein [uncultured Desulfobacterium sp.]|uniref:Iron(III) ABC transporter, ATP-binding protein n=1 Tax=uncultured Desulfobacterium sp. TaxID=201089 RepID=A0A445N0V7_9BACT|nr:Iron(III) ABC transporter, ATP-binding protein [uncultured Desulfobacterium sp.]